MNNDNYDDVVVGAPGYDNSRGRVYIYFGNAYMGNGGADPPLEGGKGVKAEWIGVISACSEDGDLKVVHSDINVDGDSDDWFPIEPTKEENKEIYQIEYTWKDLDNDNIGFASPDITTIRWCEDSEKMNFLLKIKNYTDEPIAIFIDTTQGPSGGRYENYGFNYNFNEWDAWEYAIIHDERRHYTYTLDYHTWNSRKSVSDNIIEISAPIKFNPAHATINVLVGKEPKDSARIPDVVDPRIVYDSI
ncbi:MAG: hypothetical protein L6408_00690, partial [Nanoarchaeota archaeon]|nr:hypothetical protein [Nanoarchaeota archaeon]